MIKIRAFGHHLQGGQQPTHFSSQEAGQRRGIGASEEKHSLDQWGNEKQAAGLRGRAQLTSPTIRRDSDFSEVPRLKMTPIDDASAAPSQSG
jgi:hypothetical protein